MAVEQRRICPAGKLLLLPPHDTPMNITGYFLATGLHKKWTKYFFSKEQSKLMAVVKAG